MSDDKYSDDRYQIDENNEERVTNDIKVLKLRKFGSQKNIDNIEKSYAERNRMDMIDDKESDERDQKWKRKIKWIRIRIIREWWKISNRKSMII